VIQWHVLGMFVPSFFTGHLIARFGVEKICLFGMALLILSAVVAMAGIDFANFAVALILLGLGWNFGFIGGTTLLTGTYASSERAKVQGFNDFAISATMAVASLASGKLLSGLGWNAVNLAVFPMAALAVALVLWLARQPRTRPA
jgi:MFS family permease